MGEVIIVDKVNVHSDGGTYWSFLRDTREHDPSESEEIALQLHTNPPTSPYTVRKFQSTPAELSGRYAFWAARADVSISFNPRPLN